MQPGRRPRWKQVTGVIGVLITLCGLQEPDERQLLSNARMVTHGHSMPHNPIQTYQWVSDREAILLERDALSNMRFERLDLASRTETVIPGWSTDPEPFTFPGTPRLYVSPDRQWILWVEFDLDDFSLRGGHLDGTHRFTSDGNVPIIEQPLWLSDSVHYLRFGRQEAGVNEIVAYRYSVNHPEDTHPEVVPLPAGSITDNTAAFSLVSDHRLLCCDWVATDDIAKDVKVVDVSLNTDRPSSHAFSLPAPPKAKIRELEFSPKGDRVAWLVEQEHRSSLATFLSRWFPRINSAQRPIIGIWVCRLDGTQMREIGHLPLTLKAATDDGGVLSPTLDSLRWLPDGQHLSFIYKGALYIVPTD